MRVVELSGGVGGARMARGLDALSDVELTVVVNVGDDADTHGLAISPDLDTVVYTLAGEEGARGWGRKDDTFNFNDELGRFGVDNTFRLGDRDMAVKVFRTEELKRSVPLSKVTHTITSGFGISAAVIPATDERLRTMIRTASGWITFQEYFVARRHRDEVLELRFDGAQEARPAPGVIESIKSSDLIVIAPSNPPLSIWPILSIPGVRQAIVDHPSVTAVSPLIGGKPIRGPADRVMNSLGLPAGNRGVEAAYSGLIDRLVIDSSDDPEDLVRAELEVLTTDTRIVEAAAAERLAREIVSW